jgi:hypothetical protein
MPLFPPLTDEERAGIAHTLTWMADSFPTMRRKDTDMKEGICIECGHWSDDLTAHDMCQTCADWFVNNESEATS